ncbi:MAG: hypothetical protein MK105_16840 [Crocinitomicaceae bacterium]|nr:hypothetical protein [Crocinitomicaceae bacterium]
MKHLKITLSLLHILISSLAMTQDNPWDNQTGSSDPWDQKVTYHNYPDSITQRDINRFVSDNYRTRKEFGRSLLTCTFLSAFGTPINFIKSEKESERATVVYKEFQRKNPKANDETLLKVRKRIRRKRNKTRLGGSIVGSVISLHIIGFIAVLN